MNQNVERNTFKTANVTVGILLVIFSLLISFGFFAATFFSNGISSLLFGTMAFGFLGLTLSSLFSFNIVEPKEIRVVQLFGKRKGTFEGEGIHWVLPWYSTTKHSLADFKMESPLIKVNDGRGTPIKTSITATCRIVDAEKFGKLEKGKLLKAIKEALPKSQTFFDLIENLKENFVDIDLYFEDFKEYVSDEKVHFQKILYVDVEQFPKAVIAPIIIYILEYFKTLPSKEKILVFDECWSFLSEHSQYIDECFRTFRKTGAFPIAISQSLRDFENVNQSLAQSITNNSYFKVFFPQEMSAVYDITSFDIQNISSLSFKKGVFSECYLKSTDNRFRKTIRNYLTPLELELFHTESGKDKKLNQFLARFESYFNSKDQAYEAYVRLRYENHKDDFYFTSL